jgi:hypothetical protein
MTGIEQIYRDDGVVYLGTISFGLLIFLAWAISEIFE